MNKKCFACCHQNGHDDHFVEVHQQEDSTLAIELCRNCLIRCIQFRKAQTLINHQAMKEEIDILRKDLRKCQISGEQFNEDSKSREDCAKLKSLLVKAYATIKENEQVYINRYAQHTEDQRKNEIIINELKTRAYEESTKTRELKSNIKVVTKRRNCEPENLEPEHCAAEPKETRSRATQTPQSEMTCHYSQTESMNHKHRIELPAYDQLHPVETLSGILAGNLNRTQLPKNKMLKDFTPIVKNIGIPENIESDEEILDALRLNNPILSEVYTEEQSMQLQNLKLKPKTALKVRKTDISSKSCTTQTSQATNSCQTQTEPRFDQAEMDDLTTQQNVKTYASILAKSNLISMANTRRSREITPLVKIVGIPLEISSNEEILDALRLYNNLLVEAPVEIVENYTVPFFNTNRRNIILKTSLEIQEQLCKQKKVLFRESIASCFEYVEILRCQKCCKFGHIGKYCTNKERCRKCAGSHLTKDCLNLETRRCINCINNHFDDHYHSAAYEGCPVYVESLFKLKLGLKRTNHIQCMKKKMYK